MIKVSVCTVTYNHGPYIAQAIESVLMQRGPDLEIEMIIGDDVSSDNTREIVADYARRYPDIIKPLFHAENLGPGANSLVCLNACTGEFIAALEGDDYWTDPLKLHRQIEVMKTQAECVLCVHDAEVFMEDNSQPPYLFSTKFRQLLPVTEGKITQADLVEHGWGISTASMLFRRSSLPLPFPHWLKNVFSGDFTLQLLATQHGYIYYLPQVMSRYRLHASGIMHTSNNTLLQNEKRIFEISKYQQLLGDKYDLSQMELYLEGLYSERSKMFKGDGQQLKGLYYYTKAMTVNVPRFQFHVKRLLRRILGIA